MNKYSSSISKPVSIVFCSLVFFLGFLGCDNKAKVEDRSKTRVDAVNLEKKNATDDADEEELHEHPMYEKSTSNKTKSSGNSGTKAVKTAKDVENTPPLTPNPDQAQEIPTAGPLPAPAPAPAPVPAPKPAVDPEEAKLKAMYDAKKMISTVMIDATGPDPQSDAIKWFSSAAKPITCFAAVDAAGALVVPPGVGTKQIASGTAAAPGNTPFKGANNVDVATLHSTCQICNKTGAALYLHSGNTGPFSHGAAAFADGTCVQFLIERLNAAPGGTYDHAKGNATNFVAFKIVKIGPDGKVVP